MTSILIRLVKSAVGSSVYAALAFLGAWRIDWVRGWVYAAVFVGVSVIGSLVVELANPGLLAARAKGFRKDTKPFDRQFYRLYMPLIAIYPLLAGLDGANFLWAPLPGWTLYLGVALFVLSSALGAWTMIVNRYAEPTVRIQEGQTVISSGPYHFVRHPMYLSILVGLPSTALILGSGWALVPMVLIVGLFVWRTAREDKTLHAELAGYSDYAGRTRFRLVPGLW